MNIALLRDARALIGESPTWVAAESAVFWIDVKAPALHLLGFPSGPDRCWKLPQDVGAFALMAGADGKILAALVALRNGLHRLDLSTGETSMVAAAPFDPQLTRFNEGACDSQGRFWVGTMFDPLPGCRSEPVAAGLFSFTTDQGLRREPDSAELHNGMGWSADESCFYLAHSRQKSIFAIPYDAATGLLGSRRKLATLDDVPGVPDGAAVDREGCYWCAVHGAGRLRRYWPDGRLDAEIALPVSQPTMCAFAGPSLDDMIVTSAKDKLGARELAAEPHAGGVFWFKPGVRGLARNPLVA